MRREPLGTSAACRRGVAVRQVKTSDQDPMHRRLDVAAVTVVRLSGETTAGLLRLRPAPGWRRRSSSSGHARSRHSPRPGSQLPETSPAALSAPAGRRRRATPPLASGAGPAGGRLHRSRCRWRSSSSARPHPANASSSRLINSAASPMCQCDDPSIAAVFCPRDRGCWARRRAYRPLIARIVYERHLA